MTASNFGPKPITDTKSGDRYWIDPEHDTDLQSATLASHEDCKVESPWKATIIDWLNEQRDLSFVGLEVILEHALNMRATEADRNSLKAAQIMRELGWKKERRRLVKGHEPVRIWVRPSETE